MNRKHYLLLFLLWCTTTLFAQDARFTAQVSKTNVETGEAFEITFSLNGNGDRFIPPSFGSLQILSGPNVSTSMTSINGNTTVSTAFTYDLAATQTGQVMIGPASIVVNGHTLATRPITITATKGQGRRQGNSQPQQQYDADDNTPEPSTEDLSKQLFMRAVVNKTNVYQGEQITVTYRLYTRVGILENQVDKLPELNGFWSQDINIQQNNGDAQWTTQTYKGQRFNVADVKQTVLIPEHSGNLTIDGLGMTFIARVSAPATDVVSQFFGGSYVDKKIKVVSTPVTIHVKPLPEAGKPEGYTGAVGTFNVDASVDHTSLKANEALSYNIKVSGTGNIKLLKELNVVFPADFEKYDPKVTDTLAQRTAGVSGYRVYNYLVIPRHQGNYVIEPVKFSYFNPATGKYVTLATKAFNINVAKGDNESNVTSLSSVDKQNVKLLAKDIRYIKTGASGAGKTGDVLFGSALYYLLLLLGPLLVIGAFAYRKWDEKNNSDVVKVKSRQASKIAAKHLANAQKQLQAKNSKAFYDDLFKGLYGYLSDKLNIPYANLDKEVIAAALHAQQVSDNLIKQLQDTLDLCDMARYAPVTGIAEQDVFEKAKTMINDIEDEI